MGPDLELRKCHVVVVEGGQEQDPFPTDHIVRREAANLNVIGAVGELPPLGFMVMEPLRVLRLATTAKVFG